MRESGRVATNALDTGLQDPTALISMKFRDPIEGDVGERTEKIITQDHQVGYGDTLHRVGRLLPIHNADWHAKYFGAGNVEHAGDAKVTVHGKPVVMILQPDERRSDGRDTISQHRLGR